MDYRAYYRLEVEDNQAYYEEMAALQGRDPQATARTRDADGTVPAEARPLLYNVSAEIKNTFHELGAPLPPMLEGCTVLDLCCGSGRDTYLAAQLVGERGKVIGVEPVPARLAVAQKYLAQEIKQFGYEKCNVELVCGAPEDLSALGITDGSVDVVISNCTFNLSPDKERYAAEVKRVLKEGGEWYLTDVLADRRVPLELAADPKARALRLGGALYIEDFRRLAQAAGFPDVRYLVFNKTPLTAREQRLFGDVSFATTTMRLVNSPLVEDVCEAYGERVTYDGSIPGHPDCFVFDHGITLKTGEPRSACGNISGLVRSSRYARAIAVEGDRSRHLGSTPAARLVAGAPDFDGVVDEDDQPIQASCC